MTLPSILCPTCGHESIEEHCGPGSYSHTCDLIYCWYCKSYGTRDGKRWVTPPPAQEESA